jgi:uncharacterized protein
VIATIETRIASELQCRAEQVAAAVKLLDEGSTVPFIARYRKEATGGLDDTQLRTLAERLTYLRELEDRRAAIVASITSRGKMTDELASAIDLADSKQSLEDLYLPYRQKRRTKAMIAREAGLQPLAELLLADPTRDPERAAQPFVVPDKGVADVDAALAGARYILLEQFAEDAVLVGRVRKWLEAESLVVTKVAKDKQQDPEAQRYRDYFHYDEPLARVPSHRALAIFRARKEGFLDGFLGFPPEGAATGDGEAVPECVPIGDAERGRAFVMERFGLADRGRPADRWLADTARSCWKAKLSLHVESELLSALRERAETAAIGVFAANLRDLLLAAPAGPKTILGLDPGLRTGCKIAVVDRTGKLLATATIYPHPPKDDWEGSLRVLGALCQQHGVQLVSIGNGTASRETDKLATELIRRAPRAGAAEARRQRSRRFGLFGERARGEGVPRARRVAAGRGVDRAATAGSAGRAGEDRSEGDRRRPVSARRRPDAVAAVARRRRRGLRQPRRCRPQHRERGVAGPGRRLVADAGEEHRRPP